MTRIILTDPRVKDGTLQFEGEYVVFDFECKEASKDFIVDLNYNIYVDGEKLDRQDLDLAEQYKEN